MWVVLGCGVSHMSQLSSVPRRFDSSDAVGASATAGGGVMVVVDPLWASRVVGASGRLRFLEDVCPGVSTPNSLQNDAAMSVDLVSLPDLAVVPATLKPLRREDDEDRDDLSPCTDNRFLLRAVVALGSRLRIDGFDNVDGTVLDSVALIPSSPTVACRMSSKNVQSPSLRSDAICFPVRISASRDGGGIDFRQCETLSSLSWAFTVSGERSTDGNVADRGALATRSASTLWLSTSSGTVPVTGESNESVRA